MTCALAISIAPVVSETKQSMHAVPKAASKFDYLANIGTVNVNFPGGSILVIYNAALKPGIHMALVFPDMPQTFAEAIVIRKTKPPAGIEDGQSAYKIKLLPDFSKRDELAIGVIAPSSRFVDCKGLICADLEGDGLKKTFRIAYSSEGAHMTVWNGQPLTGQRKWHGYVHFNYDVEPDATAKDY